MPCFDVDHTKSFDEKKEGAGIPCRFEQKRFFDVGVTHCMVRFLK